MPEIRYTFVSTGGREIVDTFQSIETAAKRAASASRDFDRSVARIGARRGGGDIGAGPSGGGPYRSSGGGSDAIVVRAARRQGTELITIEEHNARKRLAIQQRYEEQRLGLVRSSARRIESEINREAAARARGGMVGSAMRSVGHSILHRAVGGATGMIGSGVDAAGALVRNSWTTQSIANRLSISSRKAGGDFTDPNELRKQFEATAIATPGLKASEVGEAAAKYVELTGDLNTARGSLSAFATVASATGAKISDVATAAASIGEKFDVKKPEEMKQVLAALAFQGKEGAIELKDVAAQFQRLAAAGSAFGLEKGPAGVSKLGGLLQVARQGTGNARSAATAVENVFAGLIQKGEKNIPGLKVYAKGGGKRDINEVLADSIALAGGNDMKAKEQALFKVFGKQGIRAVNPLMTAFKDASEGKTGKAAQDAGRAAVLKTLNDMAQAGAQWAEIEKDAAQAQADTSARLTAAWEMLTASAGEKLAPAVADLATRIAGNAKVLEMFASALTAAGVTLEAFADFLARKGLIDGGSASDKASAAAKEEAKARAEMANMAGKGKMTPEQEAKYNALNAKALKAQEAKETAQGQASQEGYLLSQIRKATTKEEADAAFKAAYNAAGSKTWTTKVPFLGSNDVFQGLTGEDQNARAARHAREQWDKDHPQGGVPQSSTRGNAAGVDADVVAEQKAAAAAHKAAAEKLSAAAVRLGQRPTITGGTN